MSTNQNAEETLHATSVQQQHATSVQQQHATSVQQSFEARITDVIAGLVPWLAPIPSAVLVANATMKHLAWSLPVAIVAGLIIEGLGLTSTSTALTLWDWNARRPQGEPRAPFWLAALMVAVYLVSTIGLTVVLDMDVALVHIAPAVFPVLALVGTINIALRSQHKHRLERIESEAERKRGQEEREKAERKAERQARRQASVQQVSNNTAIDGLVDRLQAGRAAKKAYIIDAMLNAYRDNPHVGDTELGGVVGVTRQTIYNYRKELEASGRVHANGNGVEVL
jgi:ABC-type multidrug transport system fused ATPase/permease subunit